jgi:hypothetical protein
MPLILKPDPTDKTPNHFIVLCDGVQVGRIFDRVPGAFAPHNATWRWSIDSKYRRDGEFGVGGNAATREDAIIAFRKAWDVHAARSAVSRAAAWIELALTTD